MSGITDGEIASIREAQEEFMPDSGIIKRREFFGDQEQEYFPTDGVVRPACVTPGFGIWRLVADRFAGITAYTITMHWDVDIQAGDIFISDNRVFEIRDVKSPESYVTAKQCLADLTTDG